MLLNWDGPSRGNQLNSKQTTNNVKFSQQQLSVLLALSAMLVSQLAAASIRDDTISDFRFSNGI